MTCDTGQRYVLQRVNRYVFRDVDVIMENLRLLRDYLADSGEKLPMITFVDTLDGGGYYEDGEGGAWRLCDYVPDSLSLLRPTNAEDCYQSARAFGQFQFALRDFPVSALKETIPHFHDTPERCRKLREAAAADPMGRLREVGGEVAFALEREERASVLQRCRERGELPLRVTHNDTKISNVLLAAETRRALCVIDLDTVMPGLSAFDFGDMIRSGASTGAEDEPGIGLRLDFCEAFRRGFLSAAPHLTQRERELLPLGAWTMTMECGIRFLTDYLMGDKYFGIKYPGQNLARARAQFSLAADMERKWEEMLRISAANS
ncbi:MAG: phosphotransferase enzyme family protein [Clostridia bacterium]